MPTLTVNGKQAEVAKDKRLVIAIEELGIDIGHRCGGQARCTTCRVEFNAGEPDTMTKAEYAKLEQQDLLGKVRLSCQILCEHDMDVTALMTKDSEGWPDTGPAPDAQVQPDAQRLSREELETRAS